ncbi:MAG: AzlD domain-containing protein [Spirochaetota bacterium]
MNWDYTAILISITAMGAVTLACRATPFILFRSGSMPPVLSYLQRYMPAMIMLALVLNSYKTLDVLHAPWGLVYIVPGLVVAAFHAWKRNALLSIIAGTALHMLLLRLA